MVDPTNIYSNACAVKHIAIKWSLVVIDDRVKCQVSCSHACMREADSPNSWQRELESVLHLQDKMRHEGTTASHFEKGINAKAYLHRCLYSAILLLSFPKNWINCFLGFEVGWGGPKLHLDIELKICFPIAFRPDFQCHIRPYRHWLYRHYTFLLDRQ